MAYISKPYNGMAKTITELVGDVAVEVNTQGFANDLVTFRGRSTRFGRSSIRNR